MANIIPEVGPAGLGSVDALDVLICFNIRFGAFQDSLDIVGSLIDVALDIHGKPRGFWDSETEIESDASGNAAETDEQTPHVIDGGEVGYRRFKDRIFVSGSDYESDKSSGWRKD